MPRETINNATPDDPWNVKVGWDQIGSVQVGVSGPPITVGGETFDSVWSHLDRAGCNRLIAVVRRARDVAYGKDE